MSDMSELAALIDLAYKTERVASRRLAASAGISPDHALHTILLAKAGAAGLPALLEARRAEQTAVLERAAQRVYRQDTLRTARAGRHVAAPGGWRAWFDGSARPNPGRCGIGGLLTAPDGRAIEISQDAGYGSSSEAEYRALIAVLRAAIAAGARGLAIHGDSRVVIDDMSGAVPAPALSDLRTLASSLLAQLDGASLRWIPRHKNGAADALSQRAVPPLASSSATSIG